MVMERMPACMREGTPACTELGKRALVALGDASEHTGLGWGRGRPAGRSGSPPPARRAGPSRPAGPAGAARGRHWACSDGGQVAPRASFCAARTRDLPGRPAPPDAAGTGRRDPGGLGAGRGATGGRGRAGRCPAPTLPQARGERAGGLADAAAPGSRRLVGAGRGRPGRAHLVGRGREGAGRAGWGWVPAIREGPAAGDPGGPSAAVTAAPAPAAEGLHSPRGASQARRPDLLGSQGEFASRLSKMAFPGPGTNSSANKSSPFHG